MWQICVDHLCINSSRTWNHKRPKRYRTFDGRSKTIEIENQQLQIRVCSSDSGLSVWNDDYSYSADCDGAFELDTGNAATHVLENEHRRILAAYPRVGCIYSIRDDRDTTLDFYNFEDRHRLALTLPGERQRVDREIKFLRGRLKIATAERDPYFEIIRYINLCPPCRRVCEQAGRHSE